MRNAVSMWACLGLMALSAPIIAMHSEDTGGSGPASEIHSIPDRSLNVSVTDNSEYLVVNLSGKADKMDWIIFQPNSKVVSRISTSSKIDEIKISNLTPGEYVLMVKDLEGRMLYAQFTKN